MSDLQCAARFVLVTPESLPALDARALRVAGVFVDESVDALAQAELGRVAAAHGCKVEPLHAPVAREVQQLADLYRGETVLLLAPEAALRAALRLPAAPAQPMILAVDGDGWNVLSE